MNSLDELRHHGVWAPGTPLKLHLGCGETKLPGYINIDYPPSEHTVQQNVAADVFADVSTLNFPENSVDEVRLHHLFEHFDRPRAMAALCIWQRWLRPGGEILLETPDVEASAALLLSPACSYEQKQIVLRHIFGSHEAHWAYHYEGWYPERFGRVLSALGFNEICTERSEWSVIRNVTAKAKKAAPLSVEQQRAASRAILQLSLVNNAPSELRMLATWMEHFEAALAAGGYAL